MRFAAAAMAAASSAARRLDDSFGASSPPTLPPAEIAWRSVVSILLLLASALFSGLTLGLMGLDSNELAVVAESGGEAEKKWAAVILPVRKRGNHLLCTLVLGNVAVISLQSILLADLTSGLVGFVLSTILTVVFGEILPQAVCSRYALFIGAKTAPLVTVLMFLLYPITAPLAAALDFTLGDELGHLYSRHEFLTLVKLHLASKRFDKREAGIIGGAVTYRDKKVKDHMTPVDRVFAIGEDERLDYALMERIFRAGYSRVPVWSSDRSRIVGILLSKDLLLLSPSQEHPVVAVMRFFNRGAALKVDENDTLEQLLQAFMQSHQHAAVVQAVDSSGPGDPRFVVAGIISLEDVLEEVLGEEIRDEHDAMRGAVVQLQPLPQPQDPESPTVAIRPSRSVRGHPSMRFADSVVFAELGVRGASQQQRLPSPGEEDAAREAVLRAAYESTLAGGSGATAGMRMSEAEVRAVSSHLATNCSSVFGRFAPESIALLVQRAEVADAVAMLPAGVTAAVGENLSLLRPLRELYIRGAALPAGEAACTVVLQGELDLEAGADGIHSVAGPWSVLGARCLQGSSSAGFVADFSAVPRTRVARVLLIRRALFDKLADGSMERSAASGSASSSGGGSSSDSSLSGLALRHHANGSHGMSPLDGTALHLADRTASGDARITAFLAASVAAEVEAAAQASAHIERNGDVSGIVIDVDSAEARAARLAGRAAH